MILSSTYYYYSYAAKCVGYQKKLILGTEAILTNRKQINFVVWDSVTSSSFEVKKFVFMYYLLNANNNFSRI